MTLTMKFLDNGQGSDLETSRRARCHSIDVWSAHYAVSRRIGFPFGGMVGEPECSAVSPLCQLPLIILAGRECLGKCIRKL